MAALIAAVSSVTPLPWWISNCFTDTAAYEYLLLHNPWHSYILHIHLAQKQISLGEQSLHTSKESESTAAVNSKAYRCTPDSQLSHCDIHGSEQAALLPAQQYFAPRESSSPSMLRPAWETKRQQHSRTSLGTETCALWRTTWGWGCHQESAKDFGGTHILEQERNHIKTPVGVRTGYADPRFYRTHTHVLYKFTTKHVCCFILS